MKNSPNNNEEQHIPEKGIGVIPIWMRHKPPQLFSGFFDKNDRCTNRKDHYAARKNPHPIGQVQE